MADGNDNRDEIFSKAVRAGKRTYFFDVKSTKGNDLYLTITESKKRFQDDGKFFYEKHKLFLYKEDFEKFMEGFNEAVDKIDSLKESGDYTHEPSNEKNTEEPVLEGVESDDFTNLSFEDLGN
jgi:hypothetical protein